MSPRGPVIPANCPSKFSNGRSTADLDNGEAIYLKDLADTDFELSALIRGGKLRVGVSIITDGPAAGIPDLTLNLSSPLAKKILALIDSEEFVSAQQNETVKAMKAAFAVQIGKCHLTGKTCPVLSPATLQKILSDLL